MSKFIDLVKSKIGCGYVLGSQGEVMTQKLLDSLAHWNTAKNNAIAKKWIGKQCFDCSGLIVWSLQQLGFITKAEDYTADTLFYKECTLITKDELKENDLVFIKTKNSGITHVGVYIGNGQVVEAKGTPYGVVKSTLFKTDFNTFGRLKFDLEPMDLNKAIDLWHGLIVIGSPEDMKKEFKNEKLTPSRFEAFLIKSAEFVKGGK